MKKIVLVVLVLILLFMELLNGCTSFNSSEESEVRAIGDVYLRNKIEHLYPYFDIENITISIDNKGNGVWCVMYTADAYNVSQQFIPIRQLVDECYVKKVNGNWMISNNSQFTDHIIVQ